MNSTSNPSSTDYVCDCKERYTSFEEYQQCSKAHKDVLK